MLIDKSEAYDYVQKNGIRLSAQDRNAILQVYDAVHSKYNIPKADVADLLGRNISADDVGDFTLYATIDCLADFGGGKKVEDFYTEIEIKSFSRMKYKEEEVEFPIRIKCIPVTDTQWIGATDTNFLMMLRRHQMINYNINTQRTMTRVQNGSNVSWKISLNKTAIKRIETAYENEDYIPDTLTLGITDAANPSFYYDADECELVINKIDYFDIPDGYHRYMAMGNVKNFDRNFNYPMELRIINFSEEKTLQFIFQQDQKTKMKKVDSNSMNITNPANRVVENVNDNRKFIFRKEISRNQGKINFPIFATIVDYYYFRGNRLSSNSAVNKIVSSAEEELIEGFKDIANKCRYVADKPELKMQELMAIVYIIKNKLYEKMEGDDLDELMKKVNEKEIVEQFKHKYSASLALNRIIEGLF